jgi:UDP-3-O-[3-hydroxymyristoyl] N-acetylglucosamine deacetylase
MRNRTVAEEIKFSGITLHKGENSTITLKPLDEGSGIIFQRGDVRIPLSPDSVVDTTMATTIGKDNIKIHTIEHLMSAIWSLGISNLLIEIDTVEPPVLDGSSIKFLEDIEKSGLIEQSNLREKLVIEREVSVRDGERFVSISPNHGKGLSIYSKIDFSHPAIGIQEFAVDIDLESYRKEVAPARTFGFIKDFEKLKAMGLALGANYDNVIVVGEEEVLNGDGLRFENEFVRHKILDVIGDLSILGMDIDGSYRSFASSHALNSQLVKKILSDKRNYSVKS